MHLNILKKTPKSVILTFKTYPVNLDNYNKPIIEKC